MQAVREFFESRVMLLVCILYFVLKAVVMVVLALALIPFLVAFSKRVLDAVLDGESFDSRIAKLLRRLGL